MRRNSPIKVLGIKRRWHCAPPPRYRPLVGAPPPGAPSLVCPLSLLATPATCRRRSDYPAPPNRQYAHVHARAQIADRSTSRSPESRPDINHAPPSTPLVPYHYHARLERLAVADPTPSPSQSPKCPCPRSSPCPGSASSSPSKACTEPNHAPTGRNRSL